MADYSGIVRALLDKPGTFLPWVYDDTPTPQQQLRDADNPNVPTINKLHNEQFWMEQNLADPKRFWAVPGPNRGAGLFGTSNGWGI